MAGAMGLIGASAQSLSAEIAWVLVFQRTYTVGILLLYTLELPSPDPGSGRR